jgi:hypothetical protein
MIKNWNKFNENTSDSTLTHEMIKDIILFRNFSTIASVEFKNLYKLITSNDVLLKLCDEYDDISWSEGQTGLTSGYLSKLYKIVSKSLSDIENDEESKKSIKDIWLKIKNLFGKVPLFSEIEELSINIIDNGYALYFESNFISGTGRIKISYFKITNIEDHIETYEDIKTIMLRLKKSGVNVSLESFSYEWPQTVDPDEMESKIEIKVY